MDRLWSTTGSYWEEEAGYARAVRVGDHVWISGTTAAQDEAGLTIQDAGDQTRRIIDKLEQVMEAMGGSLRDVVQTRIYIRRLSDIAVVAQAHGERFHAIRPANMLSEVGLSGNILVEIEAEAIVGSGEQMRAISL